MEPEVLLFSTDLYVSEFCKSVLIREGNVLYSTAEVLMQIQVAILHLGNSILLQEF